MVLFAARLEYSTMEGMEMYDWIFPEEVRDPT